MNILFLAIVSTYIQKRKEKKKERRDAQKVTANKVLLERYFDNELLKRTAKGGGLCLCSYLTGWFLGVNCGGVFI